MVSRPVQTLRRHLTNLFTALFLFGSLICGHSTLAATLIGVGQNPSPPAGPFNGDDAQNDHITVGNSTSGRVSIVPDLNGPAWVKTFPFNRDNQGWPANDPISTIAVDEFMIINASNVLNPFGDPTIYDWHEQIDPSFGAGANFKWVGGTWVFQGGGPTFPGTVSPDGKSIEFDFPLGASRFAPILVTKQLMWSGPPTPANPVGQNQYSIRIIEQPSIPEPGTAMLAALACMGLFNGQRRKWRS